MSNPLPFVTEQWLHYLALLERHGDDLPGDAIAEIAQEDTMHADLARRTGQAGERLLRPDWVASE